MHLSGDFGYALPICVTCGSKHLYFVGDENCFGAIRSIEHYFKNLYQHFLSEGYVEGLDILNKSVIKRFTMNIKKDVTIEKITEKTYSRKLFKFFSIETTPLRFQNWVTFLELRNVDEVNYMGEHRSRMKKMDQSKEESSTVDDECNGVRLIRWIYQKCREQIQEADPHRC